MRIARPCYDVRRAACTPASRSPAARSPRRWAGRRRARRRSSTARSTTCRGSSSPTLSIGLSTEWNSHGSSARDRVLVGPERREPVLQEPGQPGLRLPVGGRPVVGRQVARVVGELLARPTRSRRGRARSRVAPRQLGDRRRPSAASCGSRCRRTTGRRPGGRRPSARRGGGAAVRRSAASAAASRRRTSRRSPPREVRKPGVSIDGQLGPARPADAPAGPGSSQSSTTSYTVTASTSCSASTSGSRASLVASADVATYTVARPGLAQPLREAAHRRPVQHQLVGVERQLPEEQVGLDEHHERARGRRPGARRRAGGGT